MLRFNHCCHFEPVIAGVVLPNRQDAGSKNVMVPEWRNFFIENPRVNADGGPPDADRRVRTSPIPPLGTT